MNTRAVWPKAPGKRLPGVFPRRVMYPKAYRKIRHNEKFGERHQLHNTMAVKNDG